MPSPSKSHSDATNKWSQKYDQCVACESNKHPHTGNGLCSKCYYLVWKKKEQEKEQERERKWDLLQKRQNQHLESKQEQVIGAREKKSANAWRDPLKPWSRKHDRCVKCGNDQARHISRGLCLKCYNEESHLKHCRGYEPNPIQEKLTYAYIYEEYIKKKRSVEEIASDCQCATTNIYKKLKRWEIPKRTRSESRHLAIEQGKIKWKRENKNGNIEEFIPGQIRVNEKFFSQWSDPMAWVLGLLYTDGNLQPVNRISLSQKEPEILNKVLTLMHCDAKLMYRERKEYENTVSGEIYTFIISNKKIYDDLARIGLTPNKSRTIEFPQVPKEYLKHFLRGCWDGDGSISMQKMSDINKKPIISATFVSGSRNFIEAMAKEMENACFLKERRIHLHNGSYSITFKGDSTCKLLYHFFYDNVPSDQYLERKHQVFIDYFLKTYKLA
jgi:hypothetical protein